MFDVIELLWAENEGVCPNGPWVDFQGLNGPKRPIWGQKPESYLGANC